MTIVSAVNEASLSTSDASDLIISLLYVQSMKVKEAAREND